MGSYLPALSVQPPPDPTQGLERAVTLRNLLQNAPIQHQILQQQQQAGSLENQQRQLQLQDQQATTAAMHEWDGKDIDQLPGIMLKKGASATAVFGMKQNLLKYKTDVLNLSKDQLANEKAKNDYFVQALDNVKSLPQEQQPAAFEAAKQDAIQKGHLDPQQAQGMSYQGPQQLDLLEKSLSGHTAVLEQAFKQAETTKNTAEATKAQTETQFMKDMGGATPEAAAFKNYMATPAAQGEAPHTPANYPAWKAASETAAKQPYELQKAKAEAQIRESMLPLTQQIMQQFGNQKDARDKIESTVFKPFQDKMTDIQMARSAISQAQDNPVAARAAIFKMIGVSQPTGSHRVLPAEISAFQYPGGITDQVKERFKGFLTGKPWTADIAQAANSFIDAQEGAQKQQLNSGIENVNKLYNTNVGGGLKQTAPTTATPTRTYRGHTYTQQPDGSWKLSQ